MAYRLHDPDFRLLRIFEVIVRNNGFVGAQVELNIAASTLSNHLAALEDRVGGKLCTRGRSGFKLTTRGLSLHAAILDLFAAVSLFERQSNGLQIQVSESIRCGVLDSVLTDENYHLPTAIHSFLKSNPGFNIHLSEENPQTLQEKLLNDELDIGLGSFPYKATGLLFRPTHVETHSLYCSSNHPLFALPAGKITLSEVHSHRLAGRTYWRDNDLRKFGLGENSTKASHIEAQLTLILSGIYIGLLPDHVANYWIAKDKLKKLLPHDVNYKCKFEIALKVRKTIPPEIEAFASAILSAYSDRNGRKL